MHAHCSSGCGGHSRWPCPCPPAGNPRLDDAARLVGCFLQTQGTLAAEAAYYGELPSENDALREALSALAEETGLRPGHVPLAPAVVDRLQRYLPAVLAAQGSNASFADLYATLLHHGTGTGLTPVAAYETALRVGMQCGLAPDRVFIHDDTQATLAGLGLTADGTGWFDPLRLPVELHPLSAAEIELCLCICSFQWQWLAAQSKETR